MQGIRMASPALSITPTCGQRAVFSYLLIGQQTLDLLDIGLVGICGHSQASLELGRLLIENVASVGRIVLDLPVFGQLKSLFCTGVRFDLGHVDSPLLFISGAD